MTTKGFKDALKLKLAKQDDNEGNEIKMEDDKLEELVKAIEKEMYLLYNRDAGTKYKAKYRWVLVLWSKKIKWLSPLKEISGNT